MSISRNELKYQLGLGKVSDITSVRKGLGQRDWQNSQVSEIDVAEVREYYRLVREEMVAPADALIQIAVDRNGYASSCDEIDSEAIDHSQHRDGEEETNGMVLAVREATQSASLAMTDVADAASEQIVDAFYIALGANVVDKLTERSLSVRSNFAQITQAIRQTPLDLRKGKFTGKKTAAETDFWTFGLIDNCVELADVLNNRLVLQTNLEQIRKEKLLINLIIFASLRPNQSNQENFAMWKLIKSIFSIPVNYNYDRTTAFLMTGVC